MLVTATSIISNTKSTREINITQEELNRVKNRRANRELIQNIVPHLSSDDREFLLSGITPEEWEKEMGSGE